MRRRLERLEARRPANVADSDSADKNIHAIHQQYAPERVEPCCCRHCMPRPEHRPKNPTPVQWLMIDLHGDRDICHAAEYRKYLADATPCTCPVCERRKLEGYPALIVTDYDRAAFR